jgi:hypothetical protein
MRKTTVKLNNNVKRALAMVRPYAEQLKGFAGFDHSAEWDHFPGTLRVRCLFADEQSLRAAQEENQQVILTKKIQMSLLKVGIVLKDSRKNVELALLKQA